MTDARSGELDRAIADVFRAIPISGPDDLIDTLEFRLRRTREKVDENEVIERILQADRNSDLAMQVSLALATLDGDLDAPWASGTEAGSVERRTHVMDLLGFGESARTRIDRAFPSVARREIVIADARPWDPWYTPERRARHDFYWNAYRGVLERKGWGPNAITALDRTTTDIVGRLADPAGEYSYQSKGLVVGYVQSGKTANFTGIVAKAIDSGYRLVIVLTGTIELLRGQTQRRLDMELVGEENILGGRNRHDPSAVRDVDYIGDDDADWLSGRFLHHDIDVHNEPGVPGIVRLTTMRSDYQRLRGGIDALDFRRTGELRDVNKPVYDEANVFSVDARLAVVKKNKASLDKLLRDLQDVHADMREIPALIIDDEADQASVNTVNPLSERARQEGNQRTAINRLISDLLKRLPRAQYIGYTATPFANVFVSPDDSEDIFPKDFIVALDSARGYMGGKEFHDIDPLDDDDRSDPSVSNEAAFVRAVHDHDNEGRAELRKAIDAFLLTGAIKKWRRARAERGQFRHHTMLVHASVKQADHSELARQIRTLWNEGGYSTLAGLHRLRELFDGDFTPVHLARDWNRLDESGSYEWPDDFNELKPFVGEAIDSILSESDPVVIVNGSADSDYRPMDFQTKAIWRIMVGGTKLSRGFTVEGLTISYYARRALAADALMQMGRWFGYRPDYADIVRLYIARGVVDARGRAYDLYDAFTSIVQDEEDFRDQLRRFSVLDDEGRPQVRPYQVPPMVFQQLPWLTPTGRNKMYNAVLTHQGEGGVLRDFPRQMDRGAGAANRRQFAGVRRWIDQRGPLQQLEYRDGGSDGREERVRTFDARVAVVGADEMYRALDSFSWRDGFSFSPTLEFLKISASTGAIEDWAVVFPELTGDRVADREVDGVTIQLTTRARRDRGGFSGSSFRQRHAIEHIAGSPQKYGGSNAEALTTRTRGAMLLTFAYDPGSTVSDRAATASPAAVDPEDVATLFSLAVPYESATRGRIGFTVRTSGTTPIVDLGA